MTFISILDRKIRFAIVGCSRISAQHFKALKAHEHESECVGVCDINPSALQAVADEHNVPIYNSMDELLKQSNPDVVVLTTPSGLHASQTIAASLAGCHVITEKPMATRFEDGIRMIQACNKAGVRLFVVKQNRNLPTLQKIKHAIQHGRFGQIYMVNINVFWTRPPAYYESSLWRGTRAMDGGAFMNQASHYVDLLDWLIGSVSTVHAYMGTLARNIETEDTGTLSLQWSCGAIGSMNVTMLTYPKNLESSITILGERGSVKIGGLSANEIQYWVFEDQQDSDEDILKINQEASSMLGDGHIYYYDNVIKVLRGEENPQTDGYEGLKSLEILSAAYRSAEEGRRVTLPLYDALLAQKTGT